MKRVLRIAGLSSLLVSAWLAACSSDPTPINTGPRLPPTLEIASVTSLGGPSWTPGADACVEIGRDDDQTVVVEAAVSNFFLRPPGACGSTRQCGTLLLRVDPNGDGELFRLEAAQATLPVPFAKLSLGEHTFRVELKDKNGGFVKDRDAGGAPLAAEVTLEVKDLGGCGGVVPDAGDGGADAGDADAGDSASDAPDDAADASDDAADATDGADDAADAPDDASDASDAADDAADAGADASDSATD